MPESRSPELLELRDRLQSFIDDDLRPLEEQLGDDVEAPIPRDVRARAAERSRELGIFGMTQPEEYGGSAAGPLALTVARETLAASNLRLARGVFGPGPGVLRAAEGAVRTEYLEPMLRGDKTGAFAFTEPAGAERPTWATRDGDDLLVTGHKAFVTGGATADFISVLVNVEEDGNAPSGTAMVAIDRESEGLTVEREFRSMEGGGHVSMAFEAVRVPLDHVIGTIGEGMPRALGNIGTVRLSMAAQATGISMWVIDHITQHLLAPHRSGTPLGEREGVRLRYADMRIETYAARSMLYRTARLAEAGEDVMNEGMATKVFATEAAGRAVDAGVQLVGGQALIVGHPLEALYRQVRSMRLAEGASDLLRLNIARGRLEFEAGRV
jgi:alkylation response protein AidB-like acyl-CoA dehydrogenase